MEEPKNDSHFHDSEAPNTAVGSELNQKESIAVETLPLFDVSPPADIKQQEDLAPIISKHQRWMEQVLDPKIPTPSGRANFSGQDLRGYDFSGKNLKCADFSNAKLDQANFAEANLARCDLRGATVLKTIFRNTCLKKAKLEGVNIQTAHLQDTDLSQTSTEPEMV